MASADSNWKIIYFETKRGECPVYDFIQSLSPVAQSKISNTFDLLTQFGIKLGLPHVKKLSGTNLWELKILGGDSLRIFYVTSTGRQFVLIHGYLKKSQKTNKKELKIALSRLKELSSRNITKL